MSDDTEARWLETLRTVVHVWMADHFGHVNVRFYAHLFDDAGFGLWSRSGITRADFEATGLHTVVARTETDLKQELVPGQMVWIRSRWVRIGNKSVTYEQELLDADTGEVHAKQRVVEVFFDPKSRSAQAIPDVMRAKLMTGDATRTT